MTNERLLAEIRRWKRSDKQSGRLVERLNTQLGRIVNGKVQRTQVWCDDCERSTVLCICDIATSG